MEYRSSSSRNLRCLCWNGVIKNVESLVPNEESKSNIMYHVLSMIPVSLIVQSRVGILWAFKNVHLLGSFGNIFKKEGLPPNSISEV